MDATVEHSLHFALLKAQSLLAKQLFLRLDGSGLTSGQPKLLEYLAGHDGCIQRELANHAHFDPASITSALVGMEESGLIRRESVPGDKRALRVYLTEAGREKQRYVQKVFADVEEVALNGFSQQERALLEDFLQRIHKNFEKEADK